jgi:acetyl-CoA synthetase
VSRTATFEQAREFLLSTRDDYHAAYAGFEWPRLGRFNWALDYFDRLSTDNDSLALLIVDEAGSESRLSFKSLRERSNKVANFLRQHGVRRGDRILVMLGNVVPLWEIALAAMKLGAVVSPATTLLAPSDLKDRIDRGEMLHVITDSVGVGKFSGVSGKYSRIVVGRAEGWTQYGDADQASPDFEPDGDTHADDPLLLYFTSGTTAKPKMVLHTHQSYPVGHLTTMYWVGLQAGDIHWNISSPGWAKHAWSSFFAPWNAGAAVFAYNLSRFDPRKALDAIVRYQVTTLCAPPTVWRLLILEDLGSFPVRLRELLSAGEPLNPEVIERVRHAWGLTIRDGYGQTETTCQIGNSPGQAIKPGSMGRPMPGYQIAPLDADGHPADAGEIGIRLKPAPAGLLRGYLDDADRTERALGGDYYRTSDVATRDADGYYWYVGRADDVFKSSDYLVSPFELESALLEYDVVMEAAVVPSPDPRRLVVPKAFVVLKPGVDASHATAAGIFRFIEGRLAPYKRVRRLEFSDLPKTISGKIRRVELRALEIERRAKGERGLMEFWEEEFVEYRSRKRGGDTTDSI